VSVPGSPLGFLQPAECALGAPVGVLSARKRDLRSLAQGLMEFLRQGIGWISLILEVPRARS
jgi:hypothetical protein